jgi:hypothetical protein
MCQHVTDIHLAAVEVNGSDQPILVTANIEYDPIVNVVRRWENGTQLRKTPERRMPHHFEPSSECCPAVRVLFPK